MPKKTSHASLVYPPTLPPKHPPTKQSRLHMRLENSPQKVPTGYSWEISQLLAWAIVTNSFA
jgi:hypothetical protein